MRRAAIAIPRVARRGVATKLIAFAGVRYVANGSKADPKPRILKVRSSINSGHSPKRPSGLFLLKKLKILRMNQDHRSASSSRQRIDHPPPRRSDDAPSSG
jgi:hypothetical protein